MTLLKIVSRQNFICIVVIRFRLFDDLEVRLAVAFRSHMSCPFEFDHLLLFGIYVNQVFVDDTLGGKLAQFGTPKLKVLLFIDFYHEHSFVEEIDFVVRDKDG